MASAYVREVYRVAPVSFGSANINPSQQLVSWTLTKRYQKQFCGLILAASAQR